MHDDEKSEAKPEEPKTSGLPEEMTKQFEAPKSEEKDAEQSEELVEKPMLGPVILGGRKSYRRKISIAVLVLVLLAIGAVLGYTFAQNKATNDAAKSSISAN
jgi:uncharacterized protein HemX